MKFRPQRSSFEESMSETVFIAGTGVILDYLEKTFGAGNFAIITPIEPIIDRRNGWNTCTVTRNGEAIGFTDGPLVR